MESVQNTLLSALGAYDSDEGSSESSSEETALAIKKTKPASLTDSEHMQSDKENTTTEQCSEEENMEEDAASEEGRPGGSVPPYDADKESLEQYQATKRDIDVLLGCDQVKDTLELPLDTPECSAELQAKFAHWYGLRKEGANFNDTLMRNKTFRNPNIYKWLVDHLKIEEAGSNLCENGFDATRLRGDFEPKMLADEQEKRAREYAAKKSAEAAAGNLRKIEFQAAVHSHTHHTHSHTHHTHSYTQARNTGAGAGAGAVASGQSYNSLGSGNRAYSSQSHGASMQNTKSFSDALERAKLIAQHLSRPKGQ
ncbi:SAP30-binding protein [Coemansia sp. RSA 2599]|nr:SAP30-binding protein [Coemansia sp. RSA 2599]